MTENIEQMQKRHEKEKITLQAKCKHKESKWMIYSWAPGHYGGNVRACTFCGKIVEREGITEKDLLTPFDKFEEERGITKTKDDM